MGVKLGGRYAINSGEYVWHELHNRTAGYAGIQVSGELTIDGTVLRGNVLNKLVGASPIYGYNIEIGVIEGGNLNSVNNAADRSNQYVVNGTERVKETIGIGTYNVNLNFGSASGKCYVCLRCGQTGGCSVGYSGTSGHPHSDWIVIGEFDAYIAPSYSLIDATQIGIVNSTNYNIKYKISGGTNNLSWKHLDFLQGTNVIKWFELDKTKSNNEQTATTKLKTTDGFKDGESYTVRIAFNDNKATYNTNTKTVYTYRTPILNNFSLSDYNFSGIGNTTLNWYTNSKRWDTTLEKDFKTYLIFGTESSWTESSNHNPTSSNKDNTAVLQTQILNESFINTHFSNSQRSVPSISTTIQMKRKNESSGVETLSDTKDITIQFQPKYTPTILQYWDFDSSKPNNKGNSITPGSTLFIDEHPYILVDWTYNNSVDRGVIYGYEVNIYTDNTYSTVFKNINVPTSTHDQLYASTKLNIKTDLKRGQLNYIGVKAYYTKPDGSGKLYGPELKQQFILPIGKIQKPVIAYPINNTTWHNKYFRVLLQSPIDDDFDTYSTSVQNNYNYKNVELSINGTIYNFTSYPNIYSVNSLRYREKICINPSLINNFIDTNVYKIKIRYQKNYYLNIWSEWSNEVTLNKSNINELNLIQNNIILATEYKTMRNYSVRLWNVYPINLLDVNNIDRNKGDIIQQKHFNGIYNTILGIQSGINNYAVYDKINCKMNESITKLTSPNNVTDDIITASKDVRPLIQGRNYWNILIESMNYLK